MRVPVPGALAAMVMAFTACSGRPAPQVVVAPDAGLTGLQTFRVVESQTFLGDIQPGETGPEIVNSATSRALGQQITTELERRGYALREMDPDVLVEYGTATREDLDPSDWNYNYLWRGPEWRGWGPGRNDATPAEYVSGAVVIDMVDGRTGELLWRGHAPVDPSGNEQVAIKRLDRTAVAILKQLPERSVALGDAATHPLSTSAQGRHST